MHIELGFLHAADFDDKIFVSISEKLLNTHYVAYRRVLVANVGLLDERSGNILCFALAWQIWLEKAQGLHNFSESQL